MDDYLITTVDNPYSPFTEFEEWWTFDNQKGYCTSGLIARLTRTSEDLSEPDKEAAIRDAIDLIAEENYNGLYRKVKSSDYSA